MNYYFDKIFLSGYEKEFYIIMGVIIFLIILHFIIGYKDSKHIYGG